MKEVVTITVNTDASFNHQHKVGGYAFYIVCDLFKIQKGGKFKNKVNSSEDAELMCIGNALATLLAQKELPKCKWLIINSDCKFGMDRLKRANGKNKIADPLAYQISVIRNKLITRLGSTKNKYRHVKAHTDKDDARSWVNDWCDKEAKRWMKLSIPKNT